MKIRDNRTFKIASAASLAVFTLISAFTATIAWFTSIRRQDVSNDNFNINALPGIVKRIKVYNQVANVPYVFKSTPAVTYDVHDEEVVQTASNEDIYIRPYESLDEYPDATLLYLFELDPSLANSGDEYFIRMRTETPDNANPGANGTKGSLVYRDANGYPVHQVVFDVSAEQKAAMQAQDPNLTDDYFGLNSMSSIISFSTKNYSTFTPVNNQFDLSSDFASVTAVSFVNQDEGQGEATFSYTNTSIDAYRRPRGSNDAAPNYVAVVCHYNAASLQYIININLGNPATDFDEIKFTMDWFFEIK